MAADDNERMSALLTAAVPLEGAARLADWGVISASGEDAHKFLHSQLTQDTLHLARDAARLAGYCSPKGRLLATFVVWRGADDEVFLACSADLLPAVLKRLTMFVLRAKCKLVDVSAQWPLWGLAGDAVLQAAPDLAVWGRASLGTAEIVRLPDATADGLAVPRCLWAGSAPPEAMPLDIDAWRWLEASSGVARVMAATAEQFVPQMINLEVVGGVDFQKGCYPGQEIVARSQYRGTLKRRGFVVRAAAALHAGQEIFHSADAGQPAGMVVLAGSRGSEHGAMVELKIAATEAGALHAGSADGPLLTPIALPYALPAEAA